MSDSGTVYYCAHGASPDVRCPVCDLAGARAENARLREALERIALDEPRDWDHFCGYMDPHGTHDRDCPYGIARRALNRETTDG